MTFPKGVFSLTDTLFLKSKVKNGYVRDTTSILLFGHELNLKHWQTSEHEEDRKKNLTLK